MRPKSDSSPTSPSIVLVKSRNSLVEQSQQFTAGELNDPFQVQKKNIRTAALIVCTFTYLIIGACVFDALEDAPSYDEKRRLEKRFAKFQLDHNMTNETFSQLSDLIINKTKIRNDWRFYDNFYFSTVVLALIGYGHRILESTRAKIFCIFYAMFGIPMWLITFQSAGERLNALLGFILSKVKQSLRLKKTKITDGELLIMESVLSIVILLIGACVFSKYEDWSFFNSFYYGFITLTTIGFGDYVVLNRNHSRHSYDKEWPHAEYYLFCLGFIFVGLTVVASLMNLLVIRIVTFYSQERLLEKLREEEAASQAVFLKGDVICSTKSRPTHLPHAQVRQQQQQQQAPPPLLLHSSQTSVCSCTCTETLSQWRQSRKKRGKRREQHRDSGHRTVIMSRSTSSLKLIFAARRSSV